MNRARNLNNNGHAGTNIENAGDHNRRVTLQAVRLNGPLSRPELARITGLTLPTVSTITAELMEKGFIKKGARRKGRRGQPAVELILDPNGGYTFGVSIGADQIVTVLVDLAGQIRGRIEHNIAVQDLQNSYQLIAESVAELTNSISTESDRILGLGVAVPARFGIENSELIPPPYLESWRSADIPAELGRACGLRVWIENDASAAALGESYFGAGMNLSTFLYVYIGYGIGAGLVIDRELFHGTHGNAGAISLLQYANQDVPPARSTQPHGGSAGSLYELLMEQGLAANGPDELEVLFNSGNSHVEHWLESTAGNLVNSIVAAQCLLDPHSILFGGRIPTSMLSSLVEKITIKLPPWLETAGHLPQMSHATSGTDVAAIGASILPFYHDVLPRRGVLVKK